MKKETKKIAYKCIKTPDNITLEGFAKGKVYRGRTFNGLFEISEEWASHKPTYLLERKEFEKYFEIVEEPQLAVLN